MDAAASSPALGPSVILERNQPCVKCAYELKGLPLRGVCPECGTPVADSLRGILLAYASGEYRKKLMTGLSLVLNGILVMVVLAVGEIALTATMGRGNDVQLISDALDLCVSLVMIVGYWFYTEPDPGYTGLEKPKSARQVLRVTIVVQACLQLLAIVLQFMEPAVALGTAAAGFTTTMVLTLVLLLLGLGASALQFFSMMRYTRWLASRVPDAMIVTRTGTYMWLLPVLATVGAIACMLGPLVALVLYWNLLDRLRKHVKSINATGEPARIK